MGASQETLSGGFRSSPIIASAIAFALAGRLLYLCGLWTRQAGFGFAGIVLANGKAISRPMAALSSLH